MTSYPEVATRVNQILTADGQSAIAAVRQQCALSDLADFLDIDFQSTK